MLSQKDQELLSYAQQAIMANYDGINYHHTVGAAVRGKSGKVYNGVNINAIHGACAEMIAIGAAFTAGERDLECIVAVRGEQGKEVVAPCGNCRQVLADYAPSLQVILAIEQELLTKNIRELLPHAYLTEYI